MTRQEAIDRVFVLVGAVQQEWGAGRDDPEQEPREILQALVGLTRNDLEEYEAKERSRRRRKV